MNDPLFKRINNLINRLFVYREDRNQIIEELISIGKPAIAELLIAFRVREFRHAQNAKAKESSSLRYISRALVGIAEKEENTLTKDRILKQIIKEMVVHMDQQFTTTPLDDNLFNKACEAAWVMGELKSEKALPHLLEGAKGNYHPTIRETALIALGEIGDEQAIPHLIELINKHDFNLHFAIDALVRLGSIAAVPNLIASLENAWDEEVRAAIIWALGQLHDPRATPKLMECVKNYKADMKAVAIQALGNLGDDSAVPILEICLEDKMALDRHDYGGTFWLFRTYRGKKVCDIALEALQQIGTPNALNTVEKWQLSQLKSQG